MTGTVVGSGVVISVGDSSKNAHMNEDKNVLCPQHIIRIFFKANLSVQGTLSHHSNPTTACGLF